MKSSIKKIKDCRVRLSVEVDSDRVEKRFSEVLREFQKNARLPGFREGKAPLDMVEKRYAKDVEEEVLKSLIPEAYHQSVVAQKTVPVTLPSISEIELRRGKSLKFQAEFEQSPEFSLKNYKGLKIRKASAEVEPPEVDRGLHSLLDARAEMTPILESRAVQHGDFVVTDIELWRDGQYVPGKKGVLLSVEPRQGDDFYEKMVGANVEDAREISVEHSDEEKKRGLVGRKPLYKIWIREIKEKKLPELDDSFAKSFGKESVEDLRQAVHKDLAGMKKTQAFDSMKAEIFEKLLTLASFALPETLVQKQAERLVSDTRRRYEQSGAAAQWESQKAAIEKEAAEKARNQVKLYFILRKIADNEGLEIDEVELDRRLNALAEESKRPLDEARRVFEDDIRESMRESKTVDFLLANAKLEEPKS